MEKLDREILEILTGDSRYSAAKIAVMLGESEEKVAEAIKRMERDGTIVKYAAVIDNEAASDEFVEAFIEVKVTPQRGTGFDAVAEEIAACEEVRSVYLMSGGYDLAVIVEGRSLRSISRFVSERISTYECVISTATHFILKKYKIEGTLTHKNASQMRLSIQP